MAVSDHLKTASAELLKAADLVKVEIDNLRKQETEVRLAQEAKLAAQLREVQHYEFEIKHNDNPEVRFQYQGAVARLTREIAQVRAELKNNQRDIENAIKQKQNMVNGLESQARSMI